MKKLKVNRTNRHHRKARSHGGTNDERNISIVCQRQHSAYHHVFVNTRPEAICEALNTIWGDPDFHFFAVEKRVVKGVQKIIQQINQ